MKEIKRFLNDKGEIVPETEATVVHIVEVGDDGRVKRDSIYKMKVSSAPAPSHPELTRETPKTQRRRHASPDRK